MILRRETAIPGRLGSPQRLAPATVYGTSNWNLMSVEARSFEEISWGEGNPSTFPVVDLPSQTTSGSDFRAPATTPETSGCNIVSVEAGSLGELV